MTKVFAIGSEAIVVALLWKQTARRIWKHHLREVLFSSAIIFFATTRDAQAYIDPGSGALIWQMLVAAFIGALFYIRNIWRWVVDWIHLLKRKAMERHE